jgi:hypothetical protein
MLTKYIYIYNRLLIEPWLQWLCFLERGLHLHGRFDAWGGGRAHYAVMDLATDNNWKLHKDCLKEAQVKGVRMW